jgi:TolA-binding protein
MSARAGAIDLDMRRFNIYWALPLPMRFRTWICCAALAFAVAAAAPDARAQGGHVDGTVRDDHGQPIRGATVRADNPDAAPSSFTASTDEKGYFAILGLRGGVWTFVAQAPGFSTETAKVPVRSLTVGPSMTFTLKKIVAPPPSGALAGVNARDLQSELAEADKLYNAEKWDDAIAAYKAILTHAPALTVINLQLGAAYRSKRDYEGAAAAYNALLKTDPSNEKARVGLAMTSLEKGDVDAAEDLLRKAVAAPNAGRDDLFTFGEIMRAKKQDADAAKYYQRAAGADPEWGKPLFRLGQLAAERGDNEAAMRLLQKVVVVDPLSPEAAEAGAMIKALRK